MVLFPQFHQIFTKRDRSGSFLEVEVVSEDALPNQSLLVTIESVVFHNQVLVVDLFALLDEFQQFGCVD